MTRNEQIKEQLKELPKDTFDSVADYVTYCAGFYDGVAWADAHPDNGLDFEPKPLEECIEAATPTWKGVDVEKYIDEVRGREPDDRWISVDDELPKNKERVFITDGECTDLGFYDYTDDSWQPCEEWLGNITHWMPLPQPPSSSEIPNNYKKGGN